MKFYTQLWKQFMRITILSFSIILTVGLLTGQASTVDAQNLNTRVDIQFDHENLYDAVKQIEQKTKLAFAYDAGYLGLKNKTVNAAGFYGKTLEAVLSQLLKGTGIAFKEEAGNILLFKQVSGKITGKVTDENGDPLPGASIRAQGTTYGTAADANGNYALTIPEGTYTIVAYFVGSKNTEFKDVVVSDSKEFVLNITIKGGSMLKEVTVSYGKQRAAEITGSITPINAAPLQSMPVGQFAQQLQGKAAGVQISETSGQPGRGMAFRIRGAASLAADYQPLFVIDGLPITGSINNINPDEIESFTILKDASASSLYGSRAANGVILITTKHAKKGESNITFNSNYGVQKIPMNKVPKMMNATQFAEFMKERWEDKVTYENLDPVKTPLDAPYVNPAANGVGTDWFHLLTRSAPIQSYDLTVQTAREKSSSSVMVGYQSQDGVVINTGTKLFSLRINQDLTLSNNKLKIGFNLAPSYRLDHNNRLTTDGVGGIFERIFEASPLISPYLPDGSYSPSVASPGMVSYLNPLAILQKTKDDYITTRILANGYLNYELLTGLNLKTNLGVDKGAETRNQFAPSVTTNAPATGLASSVDNYSWTAEANLQYEKTIANDHHIEALVGYSAQRYNSVSSSVSGTGFPSDDIPYLSAATSISAGSSTATQYSLLSTIARLNYNYKGKYLLQGAVRSDGSSRFGEDRKYGFFPSVSAGWIISNENFMEQFKNIGLLKIRASYGITGNNNIGNFTAIPVLGSYNYILNGTVVSGETIATLGNSELAWERNKQFDVGFDLSMFNNRVSFTYDYYNKVSDGLIQARPIPRASGFTTINYNVGNFAFWGHEFTLNTTNLTGALKWNSNLNISIDRNIIKNLVSPGYLRRNNTVTSDYYRNQVGHPLGAFYGFVYEGLYKDAADLANSAKYGAASDVGTIKVKDISGPNGVPDGVIDDVNDRTFIGDPTPDFTYGFTNYFSYKNFDLSISMSGQVGGQVLNAAKWAYQTNMDGSRVPLAAALDHWRSPEDPGSGMYPRTKTGTTALGREVNTQWIENGSYLTVKNITLGYTFKMKERSTFKSLRLYTSVQQAFIITGYSGMNPEVGLSGLDATSGLGVDEQGYPVPRTFSIGISTTLK